MLYDCDRCGRTCLSESAVEKAKLRGKTPLCRDCQTHQLFRVQYAEDYCVPHQGAFDVEDSPVNEFGQRLFLDEASCGHRDCVRLSHHVEPANVVFVGPSHRRGANPKKQVEDRRKKLKRGNRKGMDYSLIMALAEVQDFNRWAKVGVK